MNKAEFIQKLKETFDENVLVIDKAFFFNSNMIFDHLDMVSFSIGNILATSDLENIIIFKNSSSNIDFIKSNEKYIKNGDMVSSSEFSMEDFFNMDFSYVGPADHSREALIEKFIKEKNNESIILKDFKHKLGEVFGERLSYICENMFSIDNNLYFQVNSTESINILSPEVCEYSDYVLVSELSDADDASKRFIIKNMGVINKDSLGIMAINPNDFFSLVIK